MTQATQPTGRLQQLLRAKLGMSEPDASLTRMQRIEQLSREMAKHARIDAQRIIDAVQDRVIVQLEQAILAADAVNEAAKAIAIAQGVHAQAKASADLHLQALLKDAS